MTDPLEAEARRLRAEEQLSVRQIQTRLGIGRNRVRSLVRGVPPPAWTRRPNARDDLRAEAVVLRSGGASVVEIARRLGVSRSTAYLWVRHLPLDRDPEAARERRRAHSKVMTDAQWDAHRVARDSARAETAAATAKWVRSLRYRELILVGAAIYWCEGAKAKPWRPNDCRVRFINSDPMLVGIFLRFLEALGAPRASLGFRVSIHETADVDRAVRWWSDLVGVPVEAFQRTSLKKHRPATVRKNVGEDYRGCLTIEVPRSSRIYWKIEGIMKGMSDGLPEPGR